jgi:hypothetical protein
MQPLERRPVGDCIKRQRTVRSNMQGVADAENLTVETAVHLALNEAVQSKIHGDAGCKQRNHNEHQRDCQQPSA